jgi:ssDNA-binding Zn-finger/Zn-ribbon topoisomerase 1
LVKNNCEKKRQGQKEDTTLKTICPKCGKEYLRTAGRRHGKLWKRIGLYCPSPSCDFIIKDLGN